MRFRAKMFDLLSMKTLAALSGTIAKLCKFTVLKVTPRKMILLVTDEYTTPKQMLVWCSIEALQFFNEFSVEGPTETNEIYLELPSGLLSSSLSLLKQTNACAKAVKLKLTDKHTPCLTVEMELASDFAGSRSCTHDIPLRIIPKDEWNQYKDPRERQYSISLEVRNMKKVKGVIESLRKLSHHVILKGSSEGSLTLLAEAPTATIKSTFTHLPVISNCDDDDDNSEVRVDVKRLYQLLSCEVLNPNRLTCHLLSQELVHFKLDLDQAAFHFYLPAIEE